MQTGLLKSFFVSCLLLLLWTTTGIGSLSAQPEAPPTTCDNPRDATNSLFAWLQPNTYQPALAAICLDPAGRSQKELELLAKKTKAVYDARGLYVKMEDLSGENGWKDPKTGEAKVTPHPDLAQVVLERQVDGKWRWTRASLDYIDSAHKEMFSVLDDTLIEKLPSGFRFSLFGITVWQYLALGFLVIIGIILRKVIEFIVSNRVKPLVARFGQHWATNVVVSFSSPGATLITGLLFWVSYPALRLPVKVALVLGIAAQVLIILAVVWALYRMVDVGSEVLASKAEATESKLDDQLIPLVRKSLKVLIVIAGIIFILQNLDVNVGSLLAGLGIGGLAFALAAQDTIANFFGSLMIFVDHPFQIGDWIVFDEAEGVVEEVGFRSTRIRTFYNSLICVPNSKFTAKKVDNYGARRYRRCFTTVGLTYSTTPEQMQAFVEGCRAIIKANPHTRKDYFEVHMSGFGESSLNVMLYFFFEVPSWTDELRERHNVFLEIMRLAKDLGVSFAFPTRTLHLDSAVQPGMTPKPPEPKGEPELSEIVRQYGPGGSRGRPDGLLIAGGFVASTEETSRGSEEG